MSNIIPLRRNLPPEELDFAGALCLAFPGFVWSEGHWPERKWNAGCRPKPNIETDGDGLKLLDNFIYKLIAARETNYKNTVKLLSDDLLKARGISCPYYYSRISIAYAVRQANAAKKRYEKNKELRAKRQSELIADASEALERINLIVERYHPVLISELTVTTGRFGHAIKHTEFYDEDGRNFENYNQIAKSSNALSNIIASASKERGQYVKTNEPDVWMASFVTAIGQVWTSLTGGAPKAKGKFAEFINSAYTIVGGETVEDWFRKVEISIKYNPNEEKIDKEYIPIPMRDLLLCELAMCKEIEVKHAAAIKQAVEGNDDNPEKTIKTIRETGKLPIEIEAIIGRLPWTIESELSELTGIPAESILDVIGMVNFFEEGTEDLIFD